MTTKRKVLHLAGRKPGTSIPVGPPAYSREWVAACYGVKVGDPCPTVTIGFPDVDPPWQVDPTNVPCVCGALGVLDPESGEIETNHADTCKWLTWTDAEAIRAGDNGAFFAVSDESIVQSIRDANLHNLRSGPA